jgi:Zn-dependent protease with chaperone function
MRVDVYIPLAMSILFGLVAPWLCRRLPPARATWLLTLGSITVACSTAIALGLLALTLLGQVPDVAAFGHWTVGALRRHDPVHRSVALAAVIALPVLAALVVRAGTRRLAAIADAYRTCRRLPNHGTSLVVLPDQDITAYAVPGRPGRIVVSRGLLAALAPAHRRVVLAHEQAHLDRHHYRHLAVVAIAAALNPALFRLPAAAVYSTERWADEVAARASGDRVVAAVALARTRLLGGGRSLRPGCALAAAANQVTARVQALLADPPRTRPVLTIVALAIIVLAGTGAVDAVRDAHALFELAQRGSR